MIGLGAGAGKFPACLLRAWGARWKRPLAHLVKLLWALLVPVIGSACIVALAALAIVVKTRRCDAHTWWALLRSPTCFALHIWMLLLFYPMLCRRVLSTFGCVELRGRFLLRADQGDVLDAEYLDAVVDLLDVLAVALDVTRHLSLS